MSSLHRTTEIARDYPGVPTVVMLAAGMGSRVASMSNGHPKPTIPEDFQQKSSAALCGSNHRFCLSF